MSKIDDLIGKLCPDGVVYKELGEVCKFKRGKTITAKDAIKGDVPVIAGGQKPSYFHNEANRFGETISVSSSGAYAGFISYWTIPVFLSDSFSVNPNNSLITKYVYYFLKSIQERIHNTKKGSGVPHVHGSSISKFQIPIPPLEIQEEIVKILDSFTSLEAELEAELEARNAQYDFYRNQLLSFENKNVEWKSLGEVCNLITKGTTPKKFTESGISFIKTESFEGSLINKSKIKYVDELTHNTFLKRSILAENDILFTIAGATIGKCAFVPEKILPANTNQALAIIRLKNEVNKKFIFYVLKSPYMKKYIEISAKGSAQPNLNLRQLNDFQIPVPPLEEQERIVAILDQFDALVNGIKSGLPAEIQARRQQYKYYREKLLTFKCRNQNLQD